LTLGLQKIFGGPHVARGPHFGHPWNIRTKGRLNTEKEFKE